MDKPRGIPVQTDLFDMLSMDSDTNRVYRIISMRHGRERAITVSDIAGMTGIHPRMVRDIVKALIERHHARIGSSLGSPAGYYMIETLDEAEQNERTLRKLGISILRRASVLRGVTVRDYLKGLQADMDL